MKRLFVLTVVSLALLPGCVRHYTITLSNGERITALGKPRLENGSYAFKDARGQPASISAGRVRVVEPSSMVGSRQSSGFKAEPMK